MPNLNTDGGYRYGYQGQYAEKDKETGLNAFELRLWDARIGIWLTPDPYGQHFSPYLGMSNNPISHVDPDGGCDDCPDGEFADGAEHIGADGGTYVYDSEIGRWSDGAAVLFNIKKNPAKTQSTSTAQSLLLTGTSINSIAPSLDGPLPIMDAAAAVSQALVIVSASAYMLDSALRDDVTVTTATTQLFVLGYRGVHSNHPDFANALQGRATPIGGHDDPAMHNWGDNESIFTSWTVLKSSANIHANKNGAGGVVLMKRFRLYEIVPSPDIVKGEMEFLVPGIVTGATILSPN